MPRMISRVVRLGLVCFAAALVAPGAAADGERTVEDARFGVIKQTPEGGLSVAETQRIPNRQGVTYGWVIRLDKDRDKVRWREEFVLPGAPEQWNLGGAESIEVSEDGTTAITERTVATNDGEIANWWSVAAGDPSGEYVMRVYVEGNLVKTFDFRLE